MQVREKLDESSYANLAKSVIKSKIIIKLLSVL